MSAAKRNPLLQGIEVRHKKGCPNLRQKKASCSKCTLSYRATVYDPSIRRTGSEKSGGYHKSSWSSSLADVRGWRTEKMHAIANGVVAQPSSLTVREAFSEFIDLAEKGLVSNRSGERYKPSAVRGYRQSYDLHLDRQLGAVKFSALRRSQIQEVADRLRLSFDASTVRNAIIPLRALCKWGIRRELIASNPTTDLELPIVTGQRDRIVTPTEGVALLEALPEGDRAMWATALYVGLRMGELQALRGQDVRLLDGEIEVAQSWDPQAGVISPKSRKGYRTIQIPSVLRGHLENHFALLGPVGDDAYVFGRPDGRPFSPSSVHQRARRAWRKAGLKHVGFHDLRHTNATHRWAAMVLAGEPDPKALQEVMGHNDLKTTMDRYCKTTAAGKARAAEAFDAFMAA